MWGRFRRVVAVVGVGVAAALVVSGAALAAPGDQQGGDVGQYADFFVTRLAALLKVDKDTLVSSMKQAATATVDQAEAHGDLSPNQAERLRQQITSGEFPAIRDGMLPKGRMYGVLMPSRQAIADALAQQLGITTDELYRALRSGKTLHRIGQEHGVTDEELKAAILAVVEPKLQAAVQRGDLSPKQADRITEHIQNADLDLAFSGMGPGPHSWRECPAMPLMPPAAEEPRSAR